MGLKTLKKAELLRGKKRIENLFRSGNDYVIHPLRIKVMRCQEPSETHQVLFTVSRKLHPKAVQRNRIKRLMREAYRLHKNQLQGLPSLCIAYIYQSKEIADFQTMSGAVVQSLQKLKAYAQKD